MTGLKSRLSELVNADAWIIGCCVNPTILVSRYFGCTFRLLCDLSLPLIELSFRPYVSAISVTTSIFIVHECAVNTMSHVVDFTNSHLNFTLDVATCQATL
jgi:hypothetical protein